MSLCDVSLCNVSLCDVSVSCVMSLYMRVCTYVGVGVAGVGASLVCAHKRGCDFMF